MDNSDTAPLASKEQLSDHVFLTDEKELKFISLNMRGVTFLVEAATVARFPTQSGFGCLLSERYGVSPADFSEKANINQLYFNINPQLFHYVLDYFNTDELHFPHDLCCETILKEMQFWGMQEEYLSHCCWERLATEATVAKQHKQVIRRWRWLENTRRMVAHELPGGTLSYEIPLRENVRLFFEDCSSSIFAKLWGVFMLVIIMTSVSVLILETEHSLRSPPYEQVITKTNISMGHGVYEYYTVNSMPAHWVEMMDLFCLIILTIELIIRFVVSYRKCIFVMHPLNIADFLGIFPTWCLIGLHIYRESTNTMFDASVEKVLTCLAVMRLFRILRFVRLMTYSKQIKIIYVTIMMTYREIVILLGLMTLLSITFGSLIYYAEMKRDTFESILIGQWWAIVTMTTVGYGDYAPKTEVGYLIGVLCSITGIVHIALATTVVINNFIMTAEAVEKYIRNKRRKCHDAKAPKLWAAVSAGSFNSTSSDISAVKSSTMQDL